MSISTVVYAFVLLNLVDGALAQVVELEQPSGCNGEWSEWYTENSTLPEAGYIWGCAYDKDVCTTLSYEHKGVHIMSLMVTEGKGCSAETDASGKLKIPFLRRPHFSLYPIDGDIAINMGHLSPASANFCVFVACTRKEACDTFQFKFRFIETDCNQPISVLTTTNSDDSKSSSASTNWLLAFLPVALLLGDNLLT
jgi:hypothetical protein